MVFQRSAASFTLLPSHFTVCFCPVYFWVPKAVLAAPSRVLRLYPFKIFTNSFPIKTLSDLCGSLNTSSEMCFSKPALF